jgi:5-methylcytosine-specific restriction protein A
MCLAAGRIVPATCVDHIEPHRGDYTKFRLGQLQSLCASCHNSTKKIIEQRGYDTAIGADGWPLDPRHPCYSRPDRRARAN